MSDYIFPNILITHLMAYLQIIISQATVMLNLLSHVMNREDLFQCDYPNCETIVSEEEMRNHLKEHFIIENNGENEVEQNIVMESDDEIEIYRQNGEGPANRSNLPGDRYLCDYDESTDSGSDNIGEIITQTGTHISTSIELSRDNNQNKIKIFKSSLRCF